MHEENEIDNEDALSPNKDMTRIPGDIIEMIMM